ncbi:MAG: hypothetical protein ACXWG1_12075 [Usitatibacter sp.]
MKPPIRKDTLLNSVILFSAWLVVITACISDDVEAGHQPIRIAYEAQ